MQGLFLIEGLGYVRSDGSELRREYIQSEEI